MILESNTIYLLLADLMLVAHFAFVAFIVLGLAVIYVGGARNWSFVRNPWFRLVHLISIFIVVLQSWFGLICPLTIWEMAFRARAGDAVYGGSFVSHWLGRLLYYTAPEWVFIVSYSVLGALVMASWFLVRPRSF